MKPSFLSIMIAASLCAGFAQAAPAPTASPAPAAMAATAAKPATAQQQAAKAEIDQLVKRIEVLSKQLGPDTRVRVITRTEDGDRLVRLDDGQWREHHGAPGEVRKIRIEHGPGADAGDHAKAIERHHGDGEHIKEFRRIEHPRSMDGKAAFRNGPGLGIVMAPNPAAAGVKIAALSPEGPATKAGLRTGDVLLAVDGKSISGSGAAAVESAAKLLGGLKQDQTVKLRYARQGKTHDASVKAGDISRVMVFNRDEDGPMALRRHGREGEVHRRVMALPPGVELDIERFGSMHDCAKGEDDCGYPALRQAFRWQGLNLASLDASLGRYFGTDKGVLVLSSGAELKALQPGDVIQRVAGAVVESPREVMRALRGKESGAQLQLDVLRDRKPTSVNVKVPDSKPLPFIPPPAPRANAAPNTPGLLPELDDLQALEGQTFERIEIVTVPNQ